MGIFSRLFKKKDSTSNKIRENISFENPKCQKLWELKLFMDKILMENHYIAKSEYRSKLLNEKELVKYFGVLESSDLLETFCKKYNFPFLDAKEVLSRYMNFESIVDRHNDSYIQQEMIKEKKYLDNILYEVDSKIKLDDDQRRVVYFYGWCRCRKNDNGSS